MLKAIVSVFFALRPPSGRGRGGALFAAAALVFAFAAEEARAQSNACAFSDVRAQYATANDRTAVENQFAACAGKGWSVLKHPDFASGTEQCYCDIQVRDASLDATCADADATSILGVPDEFDDTLLSFYFGATLGFLPQQTTETADSCFVSFCPDKKEPADFGDGSIDCECAPGQVEDTGTGVCGLCPPGHVEQGDQCILLENCTGIASAVDSAGVCAAACPAGQTATTNGRVCVPDETLDDAHKCENKGWAVQLSSTEGETNVICHIKSGSSLNSLFNSDECIISTTSGCAEIFSPSLNFPDRPSDNTATDIDESDPRYAYNCDPDGVNGYEPATYNTNGQTECACPSGRVENDALKSCVIEGAVGKCEGAGWSVSTAGLAEGDLIQGGVCDIPVSTGGTVYAFCRIAGSAVPQCADAFGDDLPFPPPQTPPPRFPDEQFPFVFNCGPGSQPETVNSGGATECVCDDENMIWLDGGCAPATGRNKCRAKGWEIRDVGGADVCAVRSVNAVVSTLVAPAARISEHCNIDLYDGGECHNIFGPNLEFPRRPADKSATPYYVYNCGADDGRRGLIPAAAASGATECGCPSGFNRRGGVAVSDGGVSAQVGGGCFSGEADRAAEACEQNGWEVSLDENGWKCDIPVTDGTTEAEACYFTGERAPQCAEVFGDDFQFPQKPPSGEPPRYVYGCDGERVQNAAFTECVCEPGREEDGGQCPCLSGRRDLGGLCVPETGDFDGEEDAYLTQETLCLAFGGEALEVEDGKVCRDVDESGTFCILDSAGPKPESESESEPEPYYVFPCRGLFKHVRTCNFKFNRPALNPFVCGGSCSPLSSARGKDCL